MKKQIRVQWKNDLYRDWQDFGDPFQNIVKAEEFIERNKSECDQYRIIERKTEDRVIKD